MNVAVDFEAFYSKKLKYGLKQLIAEQYVRHELFDCYLISVFDGSTAWSGHPRDFTWSSLDGQVLLSHNAYFDRTVQGELTRRKLAPAITPSAWHCTANLTSYLCNRRSLADATQYLLKRTADKQYRDITDGKHWSDLSPEQQRIVINGGISDVKSCWEFWDKFSDKWPEHERRLSNLTIAQGMRGVQIDVAKLNDYILQSHAMLQATEKIIPWIAGAEDEEWEDFNTKPTSTKCIAEQCRKSGIPACPVKSDDEELYEEWETLYAPKHPWIHAVGSWRSINKLYKTFLEVKKRLRTDGTAPFELRYFGGHTGRWCLTGDAEVLTPTGWTRLDACSNPRLLTWKTGQLVWEDCPVVKFTTSDELITIRSRHVCGRFTAEHKFLYLSGGKAVSKPAGRLAGKHVTIPLAGHLLGGDASKKGADRLKVWAMVQADGTFTAKGRLLLGFRRTDKILRCHELLSQAHIPFQEKIWTKNPIHYFVVQARDVPSWLVKHFDARLLQFSEQSLKLFLLELSHWDGWPTKGFRSIQYSTSCESDAQWVETITHLVGWRASRHARKTDSRHLQIYISWQQSQAAALVTPKAWGRQKFSGTVYCPQTSSGYFLVRIDGKIFVTGNSGGAKWNLQNQNKKPIFANETGILETDISRIESALKQRKATGSYPEWVTADIDFRSLIVPRPGTRMIVSDLSQIEPRVLAWLSGNHKLLDKIREGFGIYEAFARTNMGYSGPRMDKDSDYYKMIKIQVLGLGYGAGAEKFIKICADGGVDITANDPEWVEETNPFTDEVTRVSGYGAESKRVVADFRAKSPLTVALWKRLDDAFKRSVGEDFSIELPSGRSLRYDAVRCSRTIKPDPKTGRPKPSWIYTADIGGRRRVIYGAKLAENLTQAVARDVFALGLLRIEDAGLKNLFSSHDEAIVEVSNDATPRDVEELMSVTPDFMPGLPVAAEAREVRHYTK